MCVCFCFLSMTEYLNVFWVLTAGCNKRVLRVDSGKCDELMMLHRSEGGNDVFINWTYCSVWRMSPRLVGTGCCVQGLWHLCYDSEKEVVSRWCSSFLTSAWWRGGKKSNWECSSSVQLRPPDRSVHPFICRHSVVSVRRVWRLWSDLWAGLGACSKSNKMHWGDPAWWNLTTTILDHHDCLSTR